MLPLGARKIYKYQILQKCFYLESEKYINIKFYKKCFHWEPEKYINIKFYNSASIGSPKNI